MAFLLRIVLKNVLTLCIVWYNISSIDDLKILLFFWLNISFLNEITNCLFFYINISLI